MQEHLSDVLDKLDHGERVLGHTMVWPSCEEKVLHLEGLGGWVTSLMGTRKYNKDCLSLCHN